MHLASECECQIVFPSFWVADVFHVVFRCYRSLSAVLEAGTGQPCLVSPPLSLSLSELL